MHRVLAVALAALVVATTAVPSFSACDALTGRWRFDAPRRVATERGWLQPAAEVLERALHGRPALAEMELSSSGAYDLQLRGVLSGPGLPVDFAVVATCRGLHEAELRAFAPPPTATTADHADDDDDDVVPGNTYAAEGPRCSAVARASLLFQQSVTAAAADRQPYVMAHGAAAMDGAVHCSEGPADFVAAARRPLRRYVGGNRTAVQIVVTDPTHATVALTTASGLVRLVASKVPVKEQEAEDNTAAWHRTGGYAALLVGIVVLKFGGKWLLQLRGADPQQWIDSLRGRRQRPARDGLIGGKTREEVLAQMARDTAAEKSRARARPE